MYLGAIQLFGSYCFANTAHVLPLNPHCIIDLFTQKVLSPIRPLYLYKKPRYYRICVSYVFHDLDLVKCIYFSSHVGFFYFSNFINYTINCILVENTVEKVVLFDIQSQMVEISFFRVMATILAAILNFLISSRIHTGYLFDIHYGDPIDEESTIKNTVSFQAGYS